MCNLYRMSEPNVATLFDARPLSGDQVFDQELFPKRRAPVVRKVGGERVLDVMTWGFPAPATARAPVTNVRNLSSPLWRSALIHPERRCLVPATDFCEWAGEPGTKVKHWFALRDGGLFAFAGVWRPVDNDRAFAFLTCEPNPLVAPIHPKAMPVILHPHDYDRWLDGDVAEVCSLAAPFPSQLMAMQ